MSFQKRINKMLLFALYQNKRISTYKISRILGCSQSFIYNTLLRYKIPIISNSQRYKGQPGRSHTEESRKKISITKLGDKNPAKRIEVRMKISKARKGIKLSKETRGNMSKAQKGRVINWGQKISAAKKQWYLTRQGQEFIKKLRKRKGSYNPMFNKSDAIRKRHWTKLWNQVDKEQIIKKFREARLKQRFPLKATTIEKTMTDELRRKNIGFVTHQSILNICQPDIVIPYHRIAIQYDGNWWHVNAKYYSGNSLTKIQRNNIARDKYQDEKLKKSGWYVIRFWESDIKKDVTSCVNKIEKLLKQVQKK